MKKKFLFFAVVTFIALISALPMLAQKLESGPKPKAIIFSEDFESFVAPPWPTNNWDWVKTAGDSTSIFWKVSTSLTYPTLTPTSGTHAATFISYSISSGNAGTMFRTQGLDLSGYGGQTVLFEFQMSHDSGYSDSNDTIQACISTDGGTTWTLLDSPFSRYQEGAAGWTKRTIDISAYTGTGFTDVRVGLLGTSAYGNNIHIDDVVVRSAGPILSYQSHSFTDDYCGTLGGPGEHNDIADPGETVPFTITIQNTGDLPATGVTGVLSTTTQGVSVTTSTASFPDIPIGETRTSTTDFVFSLDQYIECGTKIDFTLNIHSNEGNFTSNFSIYVGELVTDFFENFDGVTPPDLPTGWTEEIINGNPSGWDTYAGNACSNPNVLNYNYSSTLPADVWAYTPPLTLNSGTTYVLSFDERVASSSYPEKLSVYMGTSPNNLDMTTEIMPETQFSNTACSTLTFNITVPTSGTYYIGFHCTSDADKWRMILDNVRISHFNCNPCYTNCQPFTFDPPGPGLSPAQIGVGYNQTITANNGTPPYTYSIVGGALPDGLTMDSSGNITGTPTTQGVYTFTVYAVDSLDCQGVIQYTIEVCSTITVNPVALPGGFVGVAYSQTFTSSGGVSPYAYALYSGTLPPGLTLASNGLLSGTPTTLGGYTFEISSTDKWGCVGISPQYTVNICPVIVLAPATLPDGMINVPYSQNITATGGTSPYSYEITSGGLPEGMSLTSGGLLYGEPASTGAFPITVTATDATGCQGNRNYTLIVFPQHCGVIDVDVPALGSDSPDWPTLHGTQNTRLYRDGNPSGCAVKTCPGSSGTGARTYDAFVLPNEGCGDVCVTAILSPRCANYLVAATYLDSYDPANICDNFIGDPGVSPAQNDYVEWQFTIPLHHKAIVVVTMATAGEACNEGYVLEFIGVPCNAGVELGVNSTPLVTDTCGIGGHGDSNGALDPGEDATLSVNISNLGVATATNISATLTSASPYVTITQDSTTFPDLDPCLQVSNTGANLGIHISGSTPCGTEIEFTLQLNSDQGSWQHNFSMIVSQSAATTILEEDFETWPLSGWTIGGAGPCYWDSNAYYTNRPNYTGGTGLCADADSDRCGVAMQTTLTTPSFSLASFSTATLEFNLAWFDYYGTSYGDINISTDGGSTWTTMAQLTPDDSGIAGRASLDLTPYVGYTDCMIQFDYMTEDWELLWEIDDLVIKGIYGPLCSSLTCCPTITIDPAELPDGLLGVYYEQTVTGIGGTAPYTYTISSGGLPNGLTLNSTTGVISGIPTSTGDFSFSVVSSDANGCQGQQSYSLSITCPTITILPAILPNGFVGNAYSQIISVSGGTAPYNYVLSSGALPPNLTFNPSTQEISGTLTTAGNYSFTIEATDSYGCLGTRNYLIIVSSSGTPPEISTGSSPIDSIIFNTQENISWAGEGSATGYRLYRGTLNNLPNLLNSNIDSCLKYDGPGTTTTDTDSPLLEEGRLYWYLITAYNANGEGPAGNATERQREVNSSGNCISK
jgi:uncharacterized repeat protein (TIGR01451 family)